MLIVFRADRVNRMVGLNVENISRHHSVVDTIVFTALSKEL